MRSKTLAPISWFLPRESTRTSLLVGRPGIEPGLDVSKTTMLPLQHLPEEAHTLLPRYPLSRVWGSVEHHSL